jgi:Cys-tRNA(Pro) deacylase
MEHTTPVSNALDASHVTYRLFKHPGAVHSLEQAAKERGQRPEQVVRSILFRLGEGEFAMVLMAGPVQVSWSALRRYLGQSRLTMASEEEVRSVTGYERGAVSPVGIPEYVRLLVDESVVKEDEISIGSGVRGITVIMRSQDLLKFLKFYETGWFQKAGEE